MSTNSAHSIIPGLPSRPGRVSPRSGPLRRVIAELTRRITDPHGRRHHHRRDLRRDVVLHGRQPSPQSEPRTWRTGFAPELLSTLPPFPVHFY